ncbi:MAG: dTMP kinase [Candidatus Omnitrophota bacterium]
MAKKIKQGFFITFEGPEGSGKSTQSALLCKDLLADGYEVIHTAEPGGTELGHKLRDILLEKDNIRIDKRAELLLFEADRAQHIEEVIAPGLEQGKIVVCDRFNTATFAYQGYGLGMDMDLILKIDDFSVDGISPDLVLLLDIDTAAGLERASSGRSADRMEKRSISFHEKVRHGYLDLAKKSPCAIKVIQANDTIDRIYRLVKKEIYDFIERHKGTE